MKYLSDELIDSLEDDIDTKFKLCDKRKMQKTIRDYFIRVHNEAVESTIMASNKSVYVKPNFEDK